MKTSIPLLVAIYFSLLIACSNNRWTDKQRKEFETKCSQTEIFNNVVFQFRGFDDSDFNSILVEEYKDKTLLESFSVFVWPAQGPYEREKKIRSATIEKTMNIHNEYHFIIPGQKPFELANMKMVVWAQHTMNSEGWGCEMGDYTIDGVRFENSANPIFEKRDTAKIK